MGLRRDSAVHACTMINKRRTFPSGVNGAAIEGAVADKVAATWNGIWALSGKPDQSFMLSGMKELEHVLKMMGNVWDEVRQRGELTARTQKARTRLPA